MAGPPLFDLGDLVSTNNSGNIASIILSRLRKERVYSKTNIYTGTMATEGKLAHMIKHGTYRNNPKRNARWVESERADNIDESLIKQNPLEVEDDIKYVQESHGIIGLDKEITRMMIDPNIIFGVPEDRLAEIIGTYSEPQKNKTKKTARPLILVYNGNMLREDVIDKEQFHFKDGIKPVQALRAVVRF